MTIENLVCGIIGSIVAAIIITIASKVYLGVSGFRGLKNTVRLIRDSYKGGIVNIFPIENLISNIKTMAQKRSIYLNAKVN